MKPMLHTRWQSMELIVSRDGQEIDRVGATDIERVIVVYSDRGDTPGDLAYAVLQTHEHDLLFPPESGIAGRVHFERQLFWRERRCVYWARWPRPHCRASCAPGCGCCARANQRSFACRAKSCGR